MVQKLEKTLFYLFLILIPFQIRIFVRPANNEWDSIFIYLGDVILFLVFVLFLSRKPKIEQFLRQNWSLVILLFVAFVSIFVSSAIEISVFRWLKLVEFVLFFIYIRTRLRTPNFELRIILQTIVYSGIFQVILAVIQFIKQGSIGIRFIEAGTFDPNLPGVANFLLNNERILRAYGSLTHPNVLAGFLLLAIFCLYRLLIGSKFEVQSLRIKKPIFLLSLPILICGLFLTFSRVAIMAFVFGSIGLFLIEFFKLRKLEHTEQRLESGKTLIKIFILVFVSCLLVTTILFPYIKARFFTVSIQEQAVDLRFFYNQMALSMIKEKPILGVGVGNFVNYSHNYSIFLRAATKIAGESVNQIPEWIFQPAHNIYLLIISEIGVFGLLAFLIFVGKSLIRGTKQALKHGIVSCTLILVFCFLVIALSDHYFWTLQSGGIMFWLALALIET